MARLFKRPDSDVWYCYVPKPEGGTRKITTNCTDEDAANARAAELERDALDPDGEAAKKATVRDALELLIRERTSQAKAGKKSFETVKFYQKKGGVLLDGLAETLRRSPKAAVFLREVKASLVDDYILQRREDGVVESTIQKELTTWTLAMRLAKRRRWWRGDIDEVFPKGFSPEYKPRERFVHPDEFLRLRDAMVRPRKLRGGGVGEVHGEELFAIVCYSIATSAEWAAIWRARRADALDDLTRVFVRGSKNENRERHVPVQLFAFGVLLDYAVRHADGGDDGQGGRFMFKGSHASSFRRTLAEACKRAGIPHLSPNDLRRTHSKWLRLSGVELANIFPSMGHADDRMLQRVYAKSSASELAHLQAAQIASGPGMLMGRGTVDLGPLETSGSKLVSANNAEMQCPETESNCRHGDFQSHSLPRRSSSEDNDPQSTWEPNGIGRAPKRIGSEEPEALPGDGLVPLYATEGPGLARVAAGAERVRLEVDGRELVATEVTPGEPVADVEARLKLAAGQRGGLR